jgi:hypothetical protein
MSPGYACGRVVVAWVSAVRPGLIRVHAGCHRIRRRLYMILRPFWALSVSSGMPLGMASEASKHGGTLKGALRGSKRLAEQGQD